MQADIKCKIYITYILRTIIKPPHSQYLPCCWVQVMAATVEHSPPFQVVLGHWSRSGSSPWQWTALQWSLAEPGRNRGTARACPEILEGDQWASKSFFFFYSFENTVFNAQLTRSLIWWEVSITAFKNISSGDARFGILQLITSLRWPIPITTNFTISHSAKSK